MQSLCSNYDGENFETVWISSRWMVKINRFNRFNGGSRRIMSSFMDEGRGVGRQQTWWCLSNFLRSNVWHLFLRSSIEKKIDWTHWPYDFDSLRSFVRTFGCSFVQWMGEKKNIIRNSSQVRIWWHPVNNIYIYFYCYFTGTLFFGRAFFPWNTYAP